MNYFYIEHMIKERRQDELEELQRRRLIKGLEKDSVSSEKHLLNSDNGMHLFGNLIHRRKFRKSVFPAEILDTAYSCFKMKGFEKTTISDICKGLRIRRSQLHKHFDSLGKILEVLWAR
jgi:hypothetical protein